MDSSNNNNNNVWINRPAPNHGPGSSVYTNYFNHQAGYMVQEPGHNQYGHYGQYPVQQIPFPSTYLSQMMHERDTIKQEIEKERIREQVIVSAISNRRAMEAEVRRELMMFEGELARQRERNALLLGLHPLSNPMEGEFPRPRDSKALLLGPPHVSNPMEGALGQQNESSKALLLEPIHVSNPMEGGLSQQKESSKALLLALPPVSNPMEGDLSRQGESSNALLLGLPPATGPMQGGTIAERKSAPVAVSPEKKEKLNDVSTVSQGVVTLPFQKGACGVSRGVVALQFQTGAGDLKVSEVKPVNVTEKGKEEKKAVSLAKPNTNVSGLKRKAVSPSDSKLNKKAKRFWSCDLCQVKVAHESTFHMHLFGKKHKLKEEALQAQIAGTVGPLRKTPVSNNTAGVATDSLLLNSTKSDDVPANRETDNLNKKVETVRNKHAPERPWYPYWCNMCKVGGMSQDIIDAHRQGKKHANQVKELKAGKCNKK